MPAVRIAGAPSPLTDGTHDAMDLGLADTSQEPAPGAASLWLVGFAKLIRPISIGALMAIPTVGPAVVGIVAFFSPSRAMAMVQASTGFLQALPTDIVLMIATLATGYGVARSFDKLKKTEP